MVKNGLAAGPILLDAASGNITGTNSSLTGNLSVTGLSNLGNIGNVKITGGTNGYVLSTDGLGNLSWTAGGGGGNGTPGGSNSQVQYNKTGTFAGSAYFTFNVIKDMPSLEVEFLRNNINEFEPFFQKDFFKYLTQE